RALRADDRHGPVRGRRRRRRVPAARARTRRRCRRPAGGDRRPAARGDGRARDDALMHVEFFFAPGSRYSYLAASQVPALERETGCTVEWRPVSGTEIRSFRGRDPFVGEPVSGQYDWTYRRY